MKYFISFLSALFLLVIFSGCSSKEVFEPEMVSGDWKKISSASQEIIDATLDSALLENREVYVDKNSTGIFLKDDYRLISSSDGWIISSNIDGNLSMQYITDKSMVENFELGKTIASASVKDNILAVLFADNEMALYSISDKELLLKEQGNAPIIVDSRIVKPYFMNDLVLFLTLDGKIVIVSVTQKKKLRTIIVSSEEHFNNIISFNVLEDKLIAMSATKVLSFSQKEIRTKYEVRNAIYEDNIIYITTKQGDIISLTPELQVIAKKKFPFAHFLGLISHNDKLYALEKAGYIIEISKDLSKHDVFEVDVDDGFVYISDKFFYVGEEYISVE